MYSLKESVLSVYIIDAQSGKNTIIVYIKITS